MPYLFTLQGCVAKYSDVYCRDSAKCRVSARYALCRWLNKEVRTSTRSLANCVRAYVRVKLPSYQGEEFSSPRNMWGRSLAPLGMLWVEIIYPGNMVGGVYSIPHQELLYLRAKRWMPSPSHSLASATHVRRNTRLTSSNKPPSVICSPRALTFIMRSLIIIQACITNAHHSRPPCEITTPQRWTYHVRVHQSQNQSYFGDMNKLHIWKLIY